MKKSAGAAKKPKTKVTAKGKPEKSLVDALEKAAKDLTFAHKFTAAPEKYAEEYNLSAAQIRKIKKARSGAEAGAAFAKFKKKARPEAKIVYYQFGDD